MKSLRSITILIFLLCAEAYLLSNVFPAILALLIATYILYVLFEFDPKIEAKREVERTLYEGKKAEVKLIVKNLTKKSYRAKLFENPDFGKTDEFIIKPGENGFSYYIIPSKGFYRIKGSLEIWDLRKLFRKKFKIPEIEIEVIPSVESLKEKARIRANFLSKSTLGISMLDFHSLREFQWGDELRMIDWKASARLGELIVKEFLKEWEGDIYVVFDASREMRKKLDFSLSILSQLLISLKGKRVGLVLHDEIGIKKIVEPREPIYLLKEIRISPIKSDPSLKIPDLRISKYMRLFLRKIPSLSLSLIKMPRKSLLIFLSDLSNSDELMRVFIEVKKDCKVIVISPNPVLFYRGEMNKEIILRLYKEYLKRDGIIKKLNRIVPTIDIGPNDFKKVIL
ncbi:MAG: DUF58 domain-containing protein [Archaeoglobaceae archaeon]